MSKVYSILAGGIALSGASGYVAANGYFPESLVYLGLVLVSISEIVFLFTRHSKFAKEKLSPFSFYAATICIGALFGTFLSGLSGEELVEAKRLFMSAFVITASIFVSASIFAFLTVRRVLIYLGCIVTSLILSLIGLFMFRGPSAALLGLVIGVLYVVADTQLMIKKFENGLVEPYEDARHLFFDLVKIFIEVLKLLAALDKKEKKSN